MELSRERSARNWLISEREKCGQGQNRTADTRIFSPERVPGLCVTIGRQLNESKRLKRLCSRSICRLEHIDTNSSGKVVAKWLHRRPKADGENATHKQTSPTR